VIMPERSKMSTVFEPLLERAREVLEEAWQRRYFMFKCRFETSDPSTPLMLTFAKGGDTTFEKQLGWARAYRSAGGKPDAEAAERFRVMVEREILASDGIEPWRRGSVKTV
jgi:hypothetical protein